MCLPLLIFPCTIKSRSSVLAPAEPGGPGKRAVKRLCLWCGGGSLLSDDCMKTVFSPVCICYAHTCMPVSQQVNWVGHMPIKNFILSVVPDLCSLTRQMKTFHIF